jgi:hypothetical protein
MPFGHEDAQQISRAPSIPGGIFDDQFPCPHREGVGESLGLSADGWRLEYLDPPVSLLNALCYRLQIARSQPP